MEKTSAVVSNLSAVLASSILEHYKHYQTTGEIVLYMYTQNLHLYKNCIFIKHIYICTL